MSAVLLVLAVLCSAIAALLGFGIVTGEHVLGWLALGVTFGFASFLVAAIPWPARG